MDPQAKELLHVVRSLDPDRYVSALMAPADTVGHLMSLYAFNAELARIGRQVSEPMLGEIRLQWWRDTLADGGRHAGVETGHAVADSLLETRVLYELPKYELQGLIDARSFDIAGTVFPDEQARDTYLTKTDGALMRLGAKILGGDGPTVEQASSFAARAYGISRILQSLPAYLARGSVPLPRNELLSVGVDPEGLVASGGCKKFEVFLIEEVRRVRVMWREASRLVRLVPKQVWPAFLPLAVVPTLLAAAQRRNGRLDGIYNINPLVRFWRLWRAKSTGRF